MHVIIDQRSLTTMASALDNDELGAAIRLMTHIITTKKALPATRARSVCKMSETGWEASRDAILEHFVLDGDFISHRSLDLANLPDAALPPAPRAGVTQTMPVVYPTKAGPVPQYVAREKPEAISIRKTAGNLMVEMFKRADMSENAARGALANLMKGWPEGDVYNAIEAASRQPYLMDPRSWITAHLNNNSRPTVARRKGEAVPPPPARKSPREIVSPQISGVSLATADKIRARNANLKLDLKLDDLEKHA